MIYPVIIAGIVAGEWFLKNRMDKRKENTKTPILGGRILLDRYHNYGASLNLGQKHPKLVAAVSLFFTFIMTMVFVGTLTMRGNALLKTGLSLLLGGAYSNTYDRLRHGYVVDYFSFASKHPRLRGIIFNLSDFCIAIGAVMTAIVTIQNPNL